jgi:hypothetical protein
LNRASSRAYLFASSDREREAPPDPRRSITERFRPEVLSAYIATAASAAASAARAWERVRVGFRRREGEEEYKEVGRGQRTEDRWSRGESWNGNMQNLEVVFQTLLRVVLGLCLSIIFWAHLLG